MENLPVLSIVNVGVNLRMGRAEIKITLKKERNKLVRKHLQNILPCRTVNINLQSTLQREMQTTPTNQTLPLRK